MNTALMIYRSNTNTNSWKSFPQQFPAYKRRLNLEKEMLPEILFITPFSPRECGIASYSQDLINALNNQFVDSFECTICAIEFDSEPQIYERSPKYIINTAERNSFRKAAFNINKNDNTKLVVIQHEFSFFASKEHEFKQFYEQINKAIVFVFHTVLPQPSNEMKAHVRDMAQTASRIIVMTNHAASILKEEYTIDESKISVIPHGTHLVQSVNKNNLKEFYRLTNKKVLSTFGLLGSSKSIETALRALPTVIKKHPDVFFLILGKTHPAEIKHEGEKYRDMLRELVDELKIEQHIRFVNEYIPLPILLEYLQLSDIYLFTSKDENQVVSSTLSYAVSSGCPVISTPIPHARELLNSKNDLIFEFENHEQLSTTIVALLDDEQLRNDISKNGFQKMASTAWPNSAIAHGLLFEKLTNNTIILNARLPLINLAHIKKLTHEFGMIHSSIIANPDVNSGYTLADNAGALIAISSHFETFQNENNLRLIYIYFNFIKHCFQANGRFLNYVTKHEEFSQQNATENLDDSNGRAIWALGYLVSLKSIMPTDILTEAEELLDNALQHVDKIHSTRALAFIIKGLHYQKKEENLHLLTTLANRLMQMYKQERSKEWRWFEPYLTYGNSILPEAMLCAYMSTQKNEFKEIAQESFDFLLSKLFIDGRFKFISNKRLLAKNKKAVVKLGDERVIAVADTILSLERFYSSVKKSSYKQKAHLAFNWFLGDNRLGQIFYNPCTGGCYDGTEEQKISLNQGAESTVSYLMARLAIERMNRYEKYATILSKKEQEKSKQSTH